MVVYLVVKKSKMMPTTVSVCEGRSLSVRLRYTSFIVRSLHTHENLRALSSLDSSPPLPTPNTRRDNQRAPPLPPHSCTVLDHYRHEHEKELTPYFLALRWFHERCDACLVLTILVPFFSIFLLANSNNSLNDRRACLNKQYL